MTIHQPGQKWENTMPVPAGITSMGISAHRLATITRQFNNPSAQAAAGRAQLTRNFLVYLELAMQAKHDALMRGYCQSIGVVGRAQDGTQVRHAANATANGVLTGAGFYGQKAGIAADIARDHMVAKWRQTASIPGQAVFTPGTRVDASVQMQVQSDGFQYEVSYWYDEQDIYVLFHCYPSR
jgi:hypothetical protein